MRGQEAFGRSSLSGLKVSDSLLDRRLSHHSNIMHNR